VAVNEVQVWDFADRRDYDDEVRKASYETTSVYGFGHPLYYKNVVAVMRGTEKPETDGRAGLKSLELLVAAYRSARDGNVVSLPLER
jgi:UDP-N-acetyl-2-amino-2-deoxyglucuronate dehydrogenase